MNNILIANLLEPEILIPQLRNRLPDQLQLLQWIIGVGTTVLRDRSPKRNTWQTTRHLRVDEILNGCGS
jgi:hypothetical protein